MTYTQAQLAAGKKFLQNNNVEFYYDAEDGYDATATISIDVGGNRIWTDGTSIWNNSVVKGVKVDTISLIASKYEDDDEDKGYYWSGGLAGTISYDGSGKDGTWYDGADDDSDTMLLNKIKSKDDSDGMIYTDDGFIKNSILYMEEHCDFDSTVLSDYLDFDYSEQGMQDDGAVNLDVDMDADFWLAVKEDMDEEQLKLQAKAFA
jgi:hypothetical protein